MSLVFVSLSPNLPPAAAHKRASVSDMDLVGFDMNKQSAVSQKVQQLLALSK